MREHDGVSAQKVVSLLRPPVVVMPRSLATHGPTPPLGLAYIASALRDDGQDVELVDGPGEAIDQCVAFESPVGTLHRIGLSPVEMVARIDPKADVVGITNMFLHEWPQVRELAVLVRRSFPRALIVVGGENATAFALRILDECAAVDCCVSGEGEATMVEVVRRHRRDLSIEGMEGVVTRSRDSGTPGSAKGQVIDGGLPVRISKKELADVPRPAWDLVPLANYWARAPFFGVDRGRSLQVLGTRGCPYRCTFCSSPQMWTTRFVVRDPMDVADEIALHAERDGVVNFNFVDLTAATNRRWTLGLCDALEERKLDITWQLPVGTRIEGIDRGVLERLYATGCRNITFAPEAGSERMLEVMNKRVSLDHILRSVADANGVGLKSTVNIIVGHPEERGIDSLASLRFLIRAAWAGGDDCAVIMFCPYPGSVDYERLVASGDHVVDEASLYVGLSRSSSSHESWNRRMSPRRVRYLQLALIGAFYGCAMARRPRRILEFLRSQLGGNEHTYLDQMVRTRRKSIRPSRPPQRRRRMSPHSEEAVAPPVRRSGSPTSELGGQERPPNLPPHGAHDGGNVVVGNRSVALGD